MACNGGRAFEGRELWQPAPLATGWAGRLHCQEGGNCLVAVKGVLGELWSAMAMSADLLQMGYVSNMAELV